MDWQEDSSNDTPEPYLDGVKDFVAGTCGGITQVIAGHPLDTIKVRLQTQVEGDSKRFNGVIDCTMKTIKNEGFRGLYKGMASPLAGMAALNAVLFASYGQAKAFLQDDPDTPLTIPQLALAGMIAGLSQCIVVCPSELIKTRLQVEYASNEKRLYTGPLDCIRKTIKQKGVKGLFASMNPTILRELPAYGACFSMYELLRRAMAGEDGDVDKLGPGALIFAGGMGGVFCWTVSYPQDVIVNRIRIQPLGQPPIYRPRFFDGGFTACLTSMVKKEGWGSLWKGYTPCLLRAFPANAASFLGYELVRSLLD